MSCVDDGKRAESHTRYWTFTAAVMVNVLTALLQGKPVGALPQRVYGSAVRLLDGALKGFPYIDPLRSDVYAMVKKVGRLSEISDKDAVYTISCWRNMLEVGNERGYEELLPEFQKEVEEMRDFFEVLQNQGSQDGLSFQDRLEDLD